MGFLGNLFSIFGKEKRQYQPQQSNSYAGYAALPPEAQKLWQQQFQRMGAAQQFDPTRMQYAQEPRDMFGSQELYNLQQQSPNQGIQQVGLTEPLHQFERNALSQYGNPDYSQQGLQQYEQAFDPMRQALTGEINYNADRLRSQQAGAFGANDPRGLNIGSSPERIADMLTQQERQRRLDQMNMDIRKSALDLRNNSLAQMLESGGQIREQNQQLLSNASGQSMAQNSPQNQFMEYISRILQGLPNSQYSNTMGARPAIPGNMQKLGAVMNANERDIGNILGSFLGGGR